MQGKMQFFRRAFIVALILLIFQFIDSLYSGDLVQAGEAQYHIIKITKRHVVGKKTIRVTQGDVISLRWDTDEKVALHLHGYDIEQTALPGKSVTMKFTAKATGRFPVTSHGFGGEQGHSHGSGALFYLEVHPK
jgi:heme/copper-type cytochrome/quinol oxidase subunit 2